MQFSIISTLCLYLSYYFEVIVIVTLQRSLPTVVIYTSTEGAVIVVRLPIIVSVTKLQYTVAL